MPTSNKCKRKVSFILVATGSSPDKSVFSGGPAILCLEFQRTVVVEQAGVVCPSRPGSNPWTDLAWLVKISSQSIVAGRWAFSN